MKKSKEKIRNQIIKSIEVYKGKDGVVFYDSGNECENIVELDANDLVVMKMNLDINSCLILTTKCLFVIKNESVIRINGNEIEEFNFLNHKKSKGVETIKEFNNPAEYKSWMYSGDFIIIKKDKTKIIVNLPNHDFGFCLLNAIKKLQFVTNKYEGI